MPIVLALFLEIGKLKGIPGFTELFPIDPTLTLGICLWAAVIWRAGRLWLYPPRIFALFIPFTLMMVISLIYTPDFAAGLEKTGRFIILTGAATIAPFFVLTSEAKVRRFLLALIFIGFGVAAGALPHLDAEERLTLPGGLTIELAVVCAVTLAIIFAMTPHMRTRKAQVLMLSLVPLVFYTLLSAGARSALLSLIVSSMLIVYVNRQHFRLYAAAGVALAVMLSFVHIPDLALEYLGSLIHSDDPLNWRGHLMLTGIDLTVDRPLLGVGVGGFPYFGKESTPAPWFLYNWPHNVFIEISAEWGLPSALLMLVLVIVAFAEAGRMAFAQERHDRGMAAAVLALLVIGLLTFLNTGDINDNRPMFTYLALPFVLHRALAGRGARNAAEQPAVPAVAADRPVTSGSGIPLV